MAGVALQELHTSSLALRSNANVPKGRRWRYSSWSWWAALATLAASFLAAALFTAASIHNYPGGDAFHHLHVIDSCANSRNGQVLSNLVFSPITLMIFP